MEYTVKLIITSLIAVFAENTIFARALGTSTMLLISRKRKNIIGFGMCVSFITVVTGIICYFADNQLKKVEINAICKPLVYVLILGVVYIITLLCLWKFMYKVFSSLKKYVHVSVFNCAVLGTMFLNSEYCVTMQEYIFHGLSIGLGFVFATFMVSIVYERLYSTNVPYAFRGYPAVLIYIGILSMAFYGLLNHQLAY